MKKLLLLLTLTGLYFIAPAQNCRVDFLGTKTLYKTVLSKNEVALHGYSPVFINHVGRHGARHLTKDVSASYAFQLLKKADSLRTLTPRGKTLLGMVNALEKIENGNTKSISATGRTELTGLGRRMYTNYPAVFSSAQVLNVAITKEIRTKQSANAFLTGLQSMLKDSATVTMYNDDNDLRFYDASPAYKKFEEGVDSNSAKLGLDKSLRLDEINEAFAGRVFTPDFAAKLKGEEKAKFAWDIFGFAGIVYSLDAEIAEAEFTMPQLDFKSFFTCRELSALSVDEDADEDLKKGPGTDNHGIQVRVAIPLLVNFINTTDEFIKTAKFNAQLRFAHAETIAPFAALLQIAAADKACQQLIRINQVWPAAKIIPLASNIQWVFYKKKGSRVYLVKILLNEKPVRIDGLGVKSFPYYKWDDLRALYINKLNKLHVKLSDDMAAYLTGLK